MYTQYITIKYYNLPKKKKKKDGLVFLFNPTLVLNCSEQIHICSLSNVKIYQTRVFKKCFIRIFFYPLSHPAKDTLLIYTLV